MSGGTLPLCWRVRQGHQDEGVYLKTLHPGVRNCPERETVTQQGRASQNRGAWPVPTPAPGEEVGRAQLARASFRIPAMFSETLLQLLHSFPPAPLGATARRKYRKVHYHMSSPNHTELRTQAKHLPGSLLLLRDTLGVPGASQPLPALNDNNPKGKRSNTPAQFKAWETAKSQLLVSKLCYLG